MQNTLQAFLSAHRLQYSYQDFIGEVAAFRAEMQKGLAGQESSLKMIPAYVDAKPTAKARGRAIAVDMGGTNLRVALVNFAEDGSVETEMLRAYPMPGREGPIARDAFFDLLAEYLAPFVKRSSKIGLCFSFPCEIQPGLDGKILYFNKEVQVEGAEGESLQRNITAALRRQGVAKPVQVAVINDTVATLLGAQAQTQHRAFGGYIGFILGTGTNTCYAQQNSGITKNEGLANSKGTSLVNLESGGYAGIPRTAVDERFDATTAAPGTQLLEKLVSGEYQGGLMLEYLRSAAINGCFSRTAAAGVLSLQTLESKEIDWFCDNAYGDNTLARIFTTEADRLAAAGLVNAFFDRAAFITAVKLTAILQQGGTATLPYKPVCISAEGSTFRKCRLLNEKTLYYMAHYARGKLGLHHEFLYAENTTLAGAAFAALLPLARF